MSALSLWAGAAAVQAPLGIRPALAGAYNALPVGLLCLGAAVLALGWAPRVVLPLGILPGAGGFLLLVLAESFRWPAGVRGLSPFAHVAAVPSAPPDWPGMAGILVIAALLTALGLFGYRRGDLLA